MRKLLAVICLTAFIALQYGKVISYWQCRLAAAVTNCGCDKKMVSQQHADKEHPNPLTIAKEKAQEVFTTHQLIFTPPSTQFITRQKNSYYQLYHPASPACPVFQPPKA